MELTKSSDMLNKICTDEKSTSNTHQHPASSTTLQLQLLNIRTYSLGVNWVACKEAHDEKRQVGLGEHHSTAEPAHDHRHRCVQRDVHGVVAPRIQPVERVVCAESEDRERSVRLVAYVGAHGPAPEVVGEDGG